MIQRLIIFNVFFLLIVASGWAQSKQSEKKARTAVELHVKEKLVKGGSYTKYLFSDFETHKPVAYMDLEELLEVQKTLPSLKEQYGRKKLDSLIAYNDRQIQDKKQEIMDKKLRFSYEITHSFGIKTEDGSIKVYRYVFFLNHAFKVKDVRSIFSYELSREEANQAYYFLSRELIYDLPDVRQDERSSHEIYDFFEKALEETQYDREVFMAALRMVSVIRSNGSVDLNQYGELAIDNWIQNNRSDLKAYRSKNFSLMLDIEDDGPMKYLMYHQYTYKEGEDKQEDVVAFVLDKHFVIRHVERVLEWDDRLFEKE